MTIWGHTKTMNPRDWHLQLVWFVAGVFATGALWYFVSTKSNILAAASGVLAVLFAAFAVWLHKARDKAEEDAATNSSRRNALHDEIRLYVGEELITFTELDRTKDFDVVKVNTGDHMLGVSSEHRWIEYRYPDSKFLRQSISTLDRLRNEESDKPEHQKIFFDVIEIEFPDGRQKKIYFDISGFFSLYGSEMDPADKAASRLKELYK